jgi:phosphoserine phosphatase
VSAFASVVLDMDSTLSAIEGIDWLAARRSPEVARAVARLTDRAMEGEVPLDAVYGERLALIRPTAADVATLSAAYDDGLAPGAASALRRLRDAGVAIVIVSGGVREAITPCVERLGVPAGAVHAVSVYFDRAGDYAGYEAASPLATQSGKCVVVRGLALPRPVLAVGDGATDAALRPVVDTFAAYTGFVRREAVVRAADRELHSFDELMEVVL